jgi:hypothetical protein
MYIVKALGTFMKHFKKKRPESGLFLVPEGEGGARWPSVDP